MKTCRYIYRDKNTKEVLIDIEKSYNPVLDGEWENDSVDEIIEYNDNSTKEEFEQKKTL